MEEFLGNDSINKAIELILIQRKIGLNRLDHLICTLHKQGVDFRKEFILVNCISDSLILLNSGLQFRIDRKAFVIPNMLPTIYNLDNMVKIAMYIYTNHGVKIDFNKVIYEDSIAESMDALFQIIVKEIIKNGELQK